MKFLNWYKSSVRHLIILPVIIVAILTLLIQTYLLTHSVTEILSEEFHTRGVTVSNILATTAQEVIDRDSAIVQGFIDEYKDLKGISYIYIEDNSDQVIAHNFIPSFPEELTGQLKQSVDGKSAFLNVNGINVEEVRRGILGGRKGEVHVGINLDLIKSTARSYAVKLIFVEVLVFFLATLIIALILNSQISRLEKVSKAARDITSSGNLDQYILEHGDDEIGLLAQEFNIMVMTLKGQKEEIASMLAERTNEVKEIRQQLVEQSNLSILGEMAGSVSKELNAPLAVISENSRHMKLMMQKGMLDVPVLTQMTEKIEVTIVRIGKIIKSLKSFAQGLDVEPFERLKLLDIVKDAIELTQDYIQSRQIEMKISPVPDATINVRGIQISHVLVSLIKNGVDAIESQQVRWMQLHFDMYTDYVEIRVIDSGSGIPVEIQQKMMDPFFTTKPAGRASGIGLSMVKSILKDHSGELRYDNASKNTCFVVKLPFASASLFKT